MSAARAAWNFAGAALRPGIEAYARWSPDAERRARAGLVAEVPVGAIWLHASSVGELGAVEPLRRALAAAGFAQEMRATCQTRTGLGLARGRLGLAADLAPMDARFAVARRIARTRPSALVILETELWPALLEEAISRGLPVSWVNARLSPERFRRYAWARPLFSSLLARVRAVAAQTQADAKRFEELGVPAEAIRVTGNLKNDRPAPAALPREASGLPLDGPVIVFGSVREPEEAIVLAALEKLRRSHTALNLVVAPRHPARFEAWGARLREAGIEFSRRSAGGPSGRVLLLDTMGELGSYYGLAAVSFVGGSLAALGGHDVMEPARAGSPVLFGPHTSHGGSDPDSLLLAGAARVVTDGVRLVDAVNQWMSDEPRRREAAVAARAVAGAAQGAAARAVELLLARGGLAGPGSARQRGEAPHRS